MLTITKLALKSPLYEDSHLCYILGWKYEKVMCFKKWPSTFIAKSTLKSSFQFSFLPWNSFTSSGEDQTLLTG